MQALETYTYNNRLQPWMIELGTNANNSADYCLVYNYFTSWTAPTSCPSPSAVPTSGAGNNGNVMGYWYQDSVSTGLSHTATYTFDGVNRLTAAAATGNSTYSQSYNYTSDGSNGRYGNMSCSLGSSGYCPQVTFSSSTNRITNIGSASASYDAAGNMTNDGSHTYTWDAEGRAATVDSGSTWSFTYNALGERAEWAHPGGADEHLFDPSGTWLGTAGAYSLVPFNGRNWVVYGGGDTYFFHANNLGSTNMQTKHDGSVVGDIAFYPFGTVWAEPLSGYGYNFASLPARDLASNTDITAFRQYNFTLGRWLSPDPLAGDITNPQSLNRYAYAGNNPTTFIDPDGLYRFLPCSADGGLCNWGFPGLSGGGGGGSGGSPGGGCTLDGIYGPCPTLGWNAYAACPNNMCSGANAKGNLVYYFASAVGGGYFTYSGPGALYYSLEAAGVTGLQMDRDMTANDPVLREYGQPYYTMAGVYSFSDAQPGSPCDLSTGLCTVSIDMSAIPDGAIAIGSGHDHPYTDFSEPGFSDVDLTGYGSHHLYGFVADSAGRMLMFNPNLWPNIPSMGSVVLPSGGASPVCVLQGSLFPGEAYCHH